MMCVSWSMSVSMSMRLGSIGGGTDLRISSALSGVNFQLGNSSVSSGPRPRSMSSRLYSQLVAGVTVEVTVTKLGILDDSDMGEEDELLLLLMMDELVEGVKRSLLLSGSSADWEDRLSTEPQLMGRMQSSSP